MGRIAAILIVSASLSVLGLSSPAMATDARQAITLCEKNPNCSYNVTGGGVTLWVRDGDGKNTYVDCPPPGKGGTCTVVRGGGQVGKVLAPRASVLVAR